MNIPSFFIIVFSTTVRDDTTLTLGRYYQQARDEYSEMGEAGTSTVGHGWLDSARCLGL
jgi:hypothetical protein